jgi:cytidylate kinase
LKTRRVIAIDGPSGSGKSTCARMLAFDLGLLYIDTGAMYRALGFWAQEKSIAMEEGEQLSTFLKSIDLKYGQSESNLIEIDGTNLTEKIREHEVSKLASIISQIPSVRIFLVNFQRTLPSSNICVMEGRDIGSVVFPDSFCKIFITTKTELRAKRRLEELEKKGQKGLTLEQIAHDIEERDKSDRNRAHSPLVQTKDAVLIENGECLDITMNSLKEVVFKKAIEQGIEI